MQEHSEQETLPPLVSTGLLKEQIQRWFDKKTGFHHNQITIYKY